MRKLARFAVFVTASMSLLAMGSSAADAVTWHNAGDTAFHATSGPTTISVTGTNGVVCPSGGTMDGAVAAAPFVGTVWTAVHGTVRFPNCQLGTTGWTIECTYDLTLQTVSSGPADIACGVFFAGQRTCQGVGSLNMHYTNPVAPSTFGRLTLTTGGTLTTTNGGVGNCPLGTNDRAHVASTTFTLDSASGGASAPHLGPVITRTS